MTNGKLLTIAAIAIAAFASPAFADKQEVYAGIGTDGLGLGYRYAITDRFNIRAEYNRYEYSKNGSQGDLDYDAKLRLGATGIVADWFPFETSGFRLSAGALKNDLRFKGTARPNSANQVNLNGTNYTLSANDSVNGEVTFGKVQPYLGIGWGHRSTGGLGFFADLGVIKSQGKATLSANCASCSADPNFASNVEAERQKLQDDVSSLSWFPIAKLGVSYAF